MFKILNLFLKIMKTVSYKIRGMNYCIHCVTAVNNVLTNCPGVLEVKVSLENNEVNFQIDETYFDVEDVKIGVKNAGQYKLIS